MEAPKRRRKMIAVGLSATVLEDLDRLQRELAFGSIRPTRAEVVREAIREGIEAMGKRLPGRAA